MPNIVKNIIQKQYSEAKTIFEELIYNMVIEKMEEKKIEIAEEFSKSTKKIQIANRPKVRLIKQKQRVGNVNILSKSKTKLRKKK